MINYSVFKNFAFKFDPEFIHDVTIRSARALPNISGLFDSLVPDPKYQLKIGELDWCFPVGIAAGFDKNASAINFFDKLSFGAIEVGTVTKQPQVGNDKPRIQRHPKILSVQNAMGFPNQGCEHILKNIQTSKHQNICLGVNIGKNKDTTEAKTPEEYAYLYEKFAPFCQYLAVNISSPNTPGLRGFQKRELLTPILLAIAEKRKVHPKPTFIKIAPDLAEDDLKMICELAKQFSFDGIIATNTTVQHSFGAGGLSGAYIKPMATKIRNKACEYLKEDSKLSVIGVGGIDSYSEIKDFWSRGGGFVQIYTSFIFQGPGILKQFAAEIDNDLKQYQLKNVQELHNHLKNELISTKS